MIITKSKQEVALKILEKEEKLSWEYDDEADVLSACLPNWGTLHKNLPERIRPI